MVDTPWYNAAIEAPVRELVRLLRDNGVNTESSCGHKLCIQCQYIPDGFIKHLHDLVWNYLHEQGEPINFEIVVNHRVEDGHSYTVLDLNLRVLDCKERAEELDSG